MDTGHENESQLRERVLRSLEAHGVTPTAQRMEIAQVMLARAQHLSADQILAAVRKRGSWVSKATVYNTLKLFSQCGLVRTVTVDGDRQIFDSTTRPHHHFYNVDTGELLDIPEQAVALERLPAVPEGTEAERVDVIIRVRNRVE